ncbi:MAG: hypothetical protein ACTSPC_05100 [Candidatus Heimdallarchaeota archaeon]
MNQAFLTDNLYSKKTSYVFWFAYNTTTGDNSIDICVSNYRIAFLTTNNLFFTEITMILLNINWIITVEASNIEILFL